VVLYVGEERADLVASLDTGASYCLFQRKYAEVLGIEVERGVPMSFATANSRFEAFGHEVTIGTLDLEVHSLVFLGVLLRRREHREECAGPAWLA
jgi:predicted aspartyl protease